MKLRQVEDTPDFLKEKDDLLNVKSKLDDEQRTYGSFVLDVDQMLETTETLLVKVTEQLIMYSKDRTDFVFEKCI